MVLWIGTKVQQFVYKDDRNCARDCCEANARASVLPQRSIHTGSFVVLACYRLAVMNLTDSQCDSWRLETVGSKPYITRITNQTNTRFIEHREGDGVVLLGNVGSTL